MTGLRLFKDLKAPDSNFYSRRSGGPYYRWRYEKPRARWQWSRMHALELEERELVATRWEIVPAGLKVRLDEHYLE